jgi:hypothetical protein
VTVTLTCPPKTGPQILRVLDGNWSQGGHDRLPKSWSIPEVRIFVI